MQPQLDIDEAKLLRRDKTPMRDAHPIERPIEIGGPEIQEMQEFRKLGGNIEVLPDIGLPVPPGATNVRVQVVPDCKAPGTTGTAWQFQAQGHWRLGLLIGPTLPSASLGRAHVEPGKRSTFNLAKLIKLIVQVLDDVLLFYRGEFFVCHVTAVAQTKWGSGVRFAQQQS